mgnify:CR=1 FL=1
MTEFCKWGSYAVPEKLEYDRAAVLAAEFFKRGWIKREHYNEVQRLIRQGMDSEVKAGGPYYHATGDK